MSLPHQNNKVPAAKILDILKTAGRTLIAPVDAPNAPAIPLNLMDEYNEAAYQKQKELKHKQNPYRSLNHIGGGLLGLGALTGLGAYGARRFENSAVTPEDLKRFEYLAAGAKEWTKDNDFPRIFNDYVDRGSQATQIRLFGKDIQDVLPTANRITRLGEGIASATSGDVAGAAGGVFNAIKNEGWDAFGPLHYKRFQEGPTQGYLTFLNELVQDPKQNRFGAGFSFHGPYTALHPDMDPSALKAALLELDPDNLQLNNWDDFKKLNPTVQKLIANIQESRVLGPVGENFLSDAQPITEQIPGGVFNQNKLKAYKDILSGVKNTLSKVDTEGVKSGPAYINGYLLDLEKNINDISTKNYGVPYKSLFHGTGHYSPENQDKQLAILRTLDEKLKAENPQLYTAKKLLEMDAGMKNKYQGTFYANAAGKIKDFVESKPISKLTSPLVYGAAGLGAAGIGTLLLKRYLDKKRKEKMNKKGAAVENFVDKTKDGFKKNYRVLDMLTKGKASAAVEKTKDVVNKVTDAVVGKSIKTGAFYDGFVKRANQYGMTDQEAYELVAKLEKVSHSSFQPEK